MEYIRHEVNRTEVAEIISLETPLRSASDFLDLIANLPTQTVILTSEMLHQDFFDLSTGLAGEILQKVSNYRIRLGILGDFSNYSSKSLQHFIFESNKTNRIHFAPDIEEVLEIFA